MNGRIERRVSPITGRVTYRCRVYLGKRDGGPRWISGGSYGRLHAHGDEPCAEAALEALLKKLAAPPSSATDETAAELLERWMRDAVRPDKRANTVMAHEQAIRIHIAPRLGSILARELTPADVATWQAAQIAAGFSAKSVRNFRGTLSACYHWALRLGLVTSNPVAAVPPPRLPERHVEAVAVADAHVYLAALRDTRLWPALMLAATTGMRRGEVLALRWRDVDLATRRVTIARQFVGRTQATLEAGPLKTAAGRRTITLPQAAVDALAELRAERLAQIPAGSEWDEGALICCGRRGQPIVDRKSVV